ncbi:MAG: sigma 54-interacting transcriptional regulator [Sandaracinus sp.]|nr:sigma 54-interacting transcriptional regulator [Sandaracinus sp.]
MIAPDLFVFGGVRRNARGKSMPAVTMASSTAKPLAKPQRVFVLFDKHAEVRPGDIAPETVAKQVEAAAKSARGDSRVSRLELEAVATPSDPYDVDAVLAQLGDPSAPNEKSVVARLRRCTGPVGVGFESGTPAQIAALVELCGILGLETWALWLNERGQPESTRILDKREGTRSLREELDHYGKLPKGRSLLLVGESGTGKSHRARALHERWNPRRTDRFGEVNCAALPEHLLESELFGYKKGAFSGAATDKPGLIRECDGGTLFLDEIGEMPLPLQGKLLDVLQLDEKFRCHFRPVGATKRETASVRFVFATHRDLHARVREGAFREDLLARISTHVVKLSPFRAARHRVLAAYLRYLISIRSAFENASFHFERRAWLDLAKLAFDDDAPWSWNHRDVQQSAERLAFDAWAAQKYAPEASGRVMLTSRELSVELARLRQSWDERGSSASADEDEWAPVREALAPGVWDELPLLQRWEARYLWEARRAAGGNGAEAWRRLEERGVYVRGRTTNPSDAFAKRWRVFDWR